jgi:hypothetical protein
MATNNSENYITNNTIRQSTLDELTILISTQTVYDLSGKVFNRMRNILSSPSPSPSPLPSSLPSPSPTKQQEIFDGPTTIYSDMDPPLTFDEYNITNDLVTAIITIIKKTLSTSDQITLIRNYLTANIQKILDIINTYSPDRPFRRINNIEYFTSIIYIKNKYLEDKDYITMDDLSTQLEIQKYIDIIINKGEYILEYILIRMIDEFRPLLLFNDCFSKNNLFSPKMNRNDNNSILFTCLYDTLKLNKILNMIATNFGLTIINDISPSPNFSPSPTNNNIWIIIGITITIIIIIMIVIIVKRKKKSKK